MEEQGRTSIFELFFGKFTTLKAIFIISVIGFIVFFPALFNNFVWDDNNQVLPNVIAYGLNIPKLFGQNYLSSFGYYRPVSSIYFSIIYALFGSIPFFFHFPQIFLHLVNGILLFILLTSFIDKKLSLFLALIFVVHPIQVESVSYIAQVISVLCFLFGMSALLLSREKILKKKNLLLAFFLILLSLLTKEVGIIFIPIILLFRYLFKKGSLLIYSVLSFFTVCVYFFIRFYVGGIYFYKMTFVPISRISFPMRFINIPEIIFYYLKTFLFPVKLVIMQNWTITEMNFPQFYFPLLVVFVLVLLDITVGIYLHKAKKDVRGYIFFSLWFILGMSFYLQIIPLDMTVADRWFYFPLAGLLGIIGVIIQNVSIRDEKTKILMFLISVSIILLLSFRTILRDINWQSPVDLYTHDSMIEDDYNIESDLAFELQSGGKLDEALTHYKKSLSLYPYDTIFDNVAFIYEKNKNYKMAKEYYLKAITAVSYAPPPHKHGFAIYETVGRFFVFFDDPILAEKYIKQGLSEYPSDTILWLLLSVDDYGQGDRTDAINDVKNAYALKPSERIKTLYLDILNNRPVNMPIEAFY